MKDILIIGGGPCGLACAIEAQKLGLSTKVLEKGTIAESILKYPNGMKFFSTAPNIAIGNIPFAIQGSKASREEALQYYRNVANHYELDIDLYTAAEKVERTPQGFSVIDQHGHHHYGKKLVLATGYFDFPRTLNIPGAESTHVYRYYKEPFPFVNQPIVIFGGGNSAIEAALDLYRHDARVTMIVRGDKLKKGAKYWLLPDIENRISAGDISVYYQSTITSIDTTTVNIEGPDGNLTLPAKAVFALVGYLPDANLFSQLGLEYDKEDLVPLFDEQTFQSSEEGIYLAGTVISGTHTERVFIENGRLHGRAIVKDIAKTLK